MANEEERLGKLKSRVQNLKTELAVKQNNKDRLLKELKDEGIKSVKDAIKKLPAISKEIDDLEEQRDEKLKEAENYLSQYEV